MTHIEPLNFEKEFSRFKGDNVSVLHTLCRTMYHKLNEVIGDYEHLKEVVLCRQLESNKSSDNPTPGTEPKEYTTCYEEDCPGCKHCESSTPQTEPIELGMRKGERLYTNDMRVYNAFEYLRKTLEQCTCGSSPPLESKYEECAKEIQEVLNRRELRGNFPVLDRVMEAVKKYF